MSNLVKLEELRNKTYQDAYDKLHTFGKCAIIRPTGFGKTGILTRFCIDTQYKKILYLFPTHIIRDGVVNMANGNLPDTVQFLPYMTVARLTDERIKEEPLTGFDCIICDECHFLGAEKIGYGMQLLLNYIEQKIQLKSGLFVKITHSNIEDIYQQKTNKMELYGHFTIDNTPCKFTELYKLDKQPNKLHPTIICYGSSTHGTVFQDIHIENIAYTMGQENYYECICEKCGLHTILSETQLQQHAAMHYQQTQPAFAYLS